MADTAAPFLPILDRVLIRRIEAEATSEGFAVPEKYRQHSNLGVVIATGDNVDRITDRIKVGAKVLYGEYTAEQWDSAVGDTYWIVRVQDIRGVIQDGKPIVPSVVCATNEQAYFYDAGRKDALNG